MPSPFPGMDPFLEFHWGDVHTSLTTYARNQLRTRLPQGLVARVEEILHLQDENGAGNGHAKPDVQVVERSSAPAGGAVAHPGTSTAAVPVLVPLSKPWTERWIEIRDAQDQRLITTIEFLSLGNKQSPRQRETFRKKQDALLSAGVSLVEIDLIRRGGWTISAPEDDVPDSCAYPYRLCVMRAQAPRQAELYPAPLMTPLPAIAIPLRTGDADVTLDLQALVSQAWDDGQYHTINYAQDPRPAFRPDDEAWIEHVIAEWKVAQA